MSNIKQPKRCDCAALSQDECVCGAWKDFSRTKLEIRDIINRYCTCGGSGPGESNCIACKIWHDLFTETVE